MSTNHKNNVDQQVDLCQYKSYSEDCLPKSMSFARQYRGELETIFIKHKISDNWSYEDRVFLFICPAFRKQIDLYYTHGGKKMIQLYTEEDIITIDNILLVVLKRLFVLI